MSQNPESARLEEAGALEGFRAEHYLIVTNRGRNRGDMASLYQVLQIPQCYSLRENAHFTGTSDQQLSD
jgi:hypothetical protein